MKTITYKFADGTVSTVEVTGELYSIHKELEQQEKRNHWRETRRHISLDFLSESGIEFESPDDEPLAALIKQENNQEFDRLLASMLNIKQIELFKLKIVDRLTESEIARLTGVSQQAISQRLQTIFKKLKKLF
ncbi:MAG: hypothetical protein FWE53_05390 [Firmicutes bacterium]|nr:hypothetical protein [Bacillota bacterium]